MARLTKDEIDKLVQGDTVSSRFRDVVAAHGDTTALRWREPDGETWGAMTYAEYGDRACRVATGLSALGLKRGDRLVLLMRNRPEFHVADMAGLLWRDRVLDLHLELARADRVPRQPLGSDDRDRRGHRLPRAAAQGAGGPAEPAAHRHPRRPGRPGPRRRRHLRVAARQLAGRHRPGGERGPARGSRHHHLHVRYDGPAQGRDAVALQHRLHGRGLREPARPRAGRLPRPLLPADGAHRRTHVEPLPRHPRRAGSDDLPRRRAHLAVPAAREAADVLRCAAGMGEALRRRQRLPRGRRERGQSLRRRDGVRRRRGAGPGPGHARPRPDRDRRHRRGADPSRDPRVVPQDRRAALGDIRHVGEHRSHHVGSRGGPARHRRPRLPGLRGEAAGGRRGRLPRRQRLPRLPEGTGEDGGSPRRRRLVAHRRHRRPRRRRLSQDRRPQEGTHHHRRRQEHQPGQHRAALKSFPLIGQACVIGDNKPFISALLVLDAEVAPAWAKQHGIDASEGLAALAGNAEILSEVEREVTEANSRFSQVERVKKWTLLHDEWQADSDELTPTMKLKRRGIHTKYAAEIDAIYGK